MYNAQHLPLLIQTSLSDISSSFTVPSLPLIIPNIASISSHALCLTRKWCRRQLTRTAPYFTVYVINQFVGVQPPQLIRD
jgi:hypothetical protein